MENLALLVRQLASHDTELEWLEFKVNNWSPEMIGEDISALANAATYCGKNRGYMVFGVEDGTHAIVGTNFYHTTTKVKGQELLSWLRTMLSPHVEFEFHDVTIEDKHVVILIIYKATHHPVAFQKVDYIRVGSYTKKLSDHPSMASKLWGQLHETPFEQLHAKSNLSAPEALGLLSYPTYFDLLNLPLPTSQDGLMECMLREAIIAQQDNGQYAITNLGAILFARQLSDFPQLNRKAIRVVQYKSDQRLEILKHYQGTRGYVIEFEGLIQYIEALLPSQEIIHNALRSTVSAYPSLALREAIANALIHQDFNLTGTGPVIELLDSRIEITNPGESLIDIYRIIDNPPKSRNEALASFMRRLGMCEELGTGWDKIVHACETQRLPAPKITLYNENMKVTLFAKMPFPSISTEDRLRACYHHACITYTANQGGITNATLRERFGLPQSSSASVSRLIREAVAEGLIKPLDPTTAPRHMQYLPYWA